jgi:predicted TIM-barrel fold metal-dependent hydrolase
MEHQLREYCPKRYLELFDEEVAAARRNPRPRDLAPVVERNMDRANAVAGQHDPVARERDMDAEGIAADVIFHGTTNGEMMPFVSNTLFSTKTETVADLEAVGCRIYNRWLVDFCSVSPGRHAGLAHIPILDVDAAVAEVEWARDAGLKGVNFPAPKRQWASYVDDMYEPLWSACEACEMSLNTHVAGGEVWPQNGPYALSILLMEAPFMARRGVWFLIFSGVFERHPGLKLVITEQAGIWVPELMRDLDDSYFTTTNVRVHECLPRPPSEYWLSNCYAAATCMSHAEAEMYPTPAGKTLMWGSDYPHLEGTYPYTALSLRKTFSGIPHEHVRALIGETAADVYHLDMDELRAVAARIGPTPSELDPPLAPAEVPADYTGFAFRDRATFA